MRKKDLTKWVIGLMSLLVSGCHTQSDSPDSNAGFQWKPYQAPNQYVIHRTTGEIKIDGVIDEVEWKVAPWTEYFMDIQGQDWPVPQYQTRARMMWDDTSLYISAYLEEPHVWAYLRQRDTVIFYDNDFEVFIDPDGDTHGYYELEVNARNTVWDLLLVKPYRDGGPAIHAWDIAGLKSATQVYGSLNDPIDVDQGWSVEIAIPFNVLKEYAPDVVPPQPGQIWRLNFSRVEWKTEIQNGRYVKMTHPETGERLPEDNWVWSPQYHINMHMPEYWGKVLFVDDTLVTEGLFTDPDEEFTWNLRQLYYAQKAFYGEQGKFADQMDDLTGNWVGDPDFLDQVRLYTNPYQWIIEGPSHDPDSRWLIRSDGLIQSIKK